MQLRADDGTWHLLGELADPDIGLELTNDQEAFLAVGSSLSVGSRYGSIGNLAR